MSNRTLLETFEHMRQLFDQSRFDIRLEWGRQGAESLASSSDAVVIVDGLSFST